MTGAWNHPLCVVCGNKTVRNGKTSAGKTRWRCLSCGASTTQKRPDISNPAILDGFVGWLVGKESQAQASPTGSARTWRAKTAWCWRVEPVILVTGEIYEQILIDGTYLPYGWCLLTAQAGGKVVAWQWCNRETKAAYQAMLGRLPAPLVFVTDGHKGSLAAISETWSTTRVQRCLVHVKREIQSQTTSRPKLPAHKALWGLAQRLVQIKTLEQADTWLSLLQDFHTQWGEWLNEKTARTQVLPELVPSWVKPTQTWWYTHDKARRAYRLLARLAREGTLFTYLDPTLADQSQTGLSSTTNALEGGVNSQIKRLVYDHRGLSEPHLRRAVEWWCYLHSPHPKKPHTLIQPEHLKPQAKPPIVEPEPGPALHDTGIDLTGHDYHPNLSIRKGTLR